MHSLRNTKDPAIEASPSDRFVGKQKVIPDVILNKNRVIDAKFPCKKKVPAPLNGSHESDLTKTGQQMLTEKEEKIYPKIDGISEEPEAMTPKDAETKKGEQCKCEYKKV
jgi:hypothetical protein